MSAQASGFPKISNHFCLMLVNVCSGLARNPVPLRDCTPQARAHEPPAHTVPVIILPQLHRGHLISCSTHSLSLWSAWRTEPWSPLSMLEFAGTMSKAPTVSPSEEGRSTSRKSPFSEVSSCSHQHFLFLNNSIWKAIQLLFQKKNNVSHLFVLQTLLNAPYMVWVL